MNQEGADFELVVSDNANEDRTSEVLRGYAGDPRVLVVRQPRVLSVQENWTAALAASRGEYILMIGDDDLLLPGCLQRLLEALDAAGRPDCLSYNAARYVAPDAVESMHSSWYSLPYFNYDSRFQDGMELSVALRARLVRELFGFSVPLPLTMQLTVVGRRAADLLPHGLFRSPFPDHYAIGALLARAPRWVYRDFCPLVIGVSAKSFGHYFFNARDELGLSYLGVGQTPFGGRLPGNEVTNTQASWLLELRHDLPTELSEVRLDRSAYVVRQLWAWYQQSRLGRLSRTELTARLRMLSARDVVGVPGHLARPDVIRHAAAAFMRRNKTEYRTSPLQGMLTELPEMADITSFGAWLAEVHPETVPARPSAAG